VLCQLTGGREKKSPNARSFRRRPPREAFPWTSGSCERWTGGTLDGWKPAQVAHFGRVIRPTLAGLAQQYLFAWNGGPANKAVRPLRVSIVIPVTMMAKTIRTIVRSEYVASPRRTARSSSSTTVRPRWLAQILLRPQIAPLVDKGDLP